MNEYRECPYCGEKILQKAIKCRYCLSMLENTTGDGFAPPPPPPSPPSTGPIVFSPPAPDQINEPVTQGQGFVCKTNKQVVIPPPPPVYRTQAPGVTAAAQVSGDAGSKSTAKVQSPPPPLPPPSAAISDDVPPPQANINPAVKRLSEFPKASFIRRFLAYMIDSFIVSLPFQLIYFFTPLKEELEIYYNEFQLTGGFVIRDEEIFYALLVIIAVLSLWGVYYLLFKDGNKKGRSRGKRIMGLMVVSLHTGKPCGKGRSFLRNFILFIPYINIMFLLIEFISVVSSPQGKRLGDIIAGTQVIKASEYHGRQSFTGSKVL